MARATVAVALACLAGAGGGGAPAHADTGLQPTYQANDYGQGHVFGITPPGENGLVTAAQVLPAEGGSRPPNSNDTLPLYANLLYHDQGLTDAQIGQYFPEESFGVAPGKITRTEDPGGRSDVAVYRDQWGIAHIYGTTDAAMEFGAGYVAAEDRLFFMDVLRHYGSSSLTSWLGPSCGDEQMDHDQLLLTGGYSHADKLRQIQASATLDPVLGPRGLTMAQGYIDGINQYINDARTDPTKLPADYAAISPDPANPVFPQPFDVTNIVDIATVIGGQLGRGGGNETGNAAFLRFLQDRFGNTAAAAIFRDMKQQNDPDAPTTADTAFPYEIPGTIDPSLTVMPDVNLNDASSSSGLHITRPDQRQAAGCDAFSNPAGILPGIGLPKGAAARAVVDAALHFPHDLSNALLVDTNHSAEGHPLAVFGSQAAYFAPEIWMQQDLHSPNYDAAGFSIPGISMIIEIGRGRDYAWSATSASSDNVDLRIETLCGPGGGVPSAMATSYLHNGACVPMSQRTYTQIGLPSLGSMAGPQIFTQQILTTVHGVVQGWTTSGGRPVAVVMQRSTYESEPDSVLGFLRWGTPALTHDAQSWMVGSRQIAFPFNWLYVDDRDIAYAVSGRDPIRPSSLDPNLPATGVGTAEWQGFLSDAGHPHQIGSAKGYITSWNNKPAPLFSASDSQYEYGMTYRNQSLVDAIRVQLAQHGGRITEANLVTAMEEAASADLEGTRILPELLPYLASTNSSVPEAPQVSAMVAQLSTWLADGAHRRRAAPGDTQYHDAAGVAIMDEVYPHLIEAIFDPLFADSRLAGNGHTRQDGLDNAYARVPFEWANNPNFDGQHLGSAYDGGWDGYIVKVLRELRGETVGQPFSAALMARICGGGPGACAARIEHAFEAAGVALQADNGTPSVGEWVYTTATATLTAQARKGNPNAAAVTLPDYDAIHYRSIGVIGQPNQHWQNRPTQQQVVLFPSHRDRTGGGGGTSGGGGGSPTGTPSNPNTAAPGASGWSLLLAAGIVAAMRPWGRRRRRARCAEPPPTLADSRGDGDRRPPRRAPP